MKKAKWILLYAAMLSSLLWVAGCSKDGTDNLNGPVDTSQPVDPSEPSISIDTDEGILSQENEETTIDLACCLTPTVQCISSTDSSITLRICTGATGAPGGLVLQWYRLPNGVTCDAFTFPSSGVPTAHLTGAACLPPYACVIVTLLNVPCNETYAFRARALNQYLCSSPYSGKVCCSTQDCPDQNPPPDTCLTTPVLTCEEATDSTLTLQVCAGPLGAPSGFVVQRYALPEGVNCASFTWPTTGVVTTYYISSGYRLDPNECVSITVPHLDCETEYVFRIKALVCYPYCPSPWSGNVCCVTDDCPDTTPPDTCLAEPVVTCVDATDSTVTIRVCAGETGAPVGFNLQFAELPAGVTCEAFTWGDGVTTQSYTSSSFWLDPNECVNVTLYGLDCETTYAFRAKALQCLPFTCPSDYSAAVCCATDDCPDQLPCLDVPVVTCYDATDSTLVLQVCAGATGAGAGVEIQYAALPASTECGAFNWSAGVQSVTTGPLSPNQCVTVTIPYLECETAYVFRAKALLCAPNPCPSDWTANVCCVTDDCPDTTPPDTCLTEPVVTCVDATDSTLVISVCAGETGAPVGFSLQVAALPTGVECGSFAWGTGVFTFNFTSSHYWLDPNECINITIRGVDCEAAYVFRAKALVCPPFTCPSDWSDNVCCVTDDCPDQGPGDGCTYTQGFWKNHPEAWPVQSLTVGTVLYNQTDLLFALHRNSSGGNALVILARQLIAAKLNVANGADDTQVAAIIAQADALIGSLSITSGLIRANTTLGAQMLALASILDQFNNGNLGVPHCDS